MEITVNKADLVVKINDLLINNVLAQCAQQGLDEEETNAHVVLNRKKAVQDAVNIANLVFAAYGYNEEPAVEESAE